jgi:hypothetical protein
VLCPFRLCVLSLPNKIRALNLSLTTAVPHFVSNKEA